MDNSKNRVYIPDQNRDFICFLMQIKELQLEPHERIDTPLTAAAYRNTLLSLLCLTAGIVDVIGYLSLGHVFTANMTGNIVFIGISNRKISSSHCFSFFNCANRLYRGSDCFHDHCWKGRENILAIRCNKSSGN